MNEDKLYSFIMRGELTKVSLEDSGVVSKHSSSAALTQKYIDSLSLDLLDDLLLHRLVFFCTACLRINISVVKFFYKPWHK